MNYRIKPVSAHVADGTRPTKRRGHADPHSSRRIRNERDMEHQKESQGIVGRAFIRFDRVPIIPWSPNRIPSSRSSGSSHSPRLLGSRLPMAKSAMNLSRGLTAAGTAPDFHRYSLLIPCRRPACGNLTATKIIHLFFRGASSAIFDPNFHSGFPPKAAPYYRHDIATGLCRKC